MLRKLAVMVGWGGAAIALWITFWMAALGNPLGPVVAAYAVALGTTFALHRATRGPLVLAVAFGFLWALFAGGIALLAEDSRVLYKRGLLSLPVVLPLVALIVRRLATDPEDAWFRRYAWWVAPPSLVLALPLLVVGAIGSAKHDPVPYAVARRDLVDPSSMAFGSWFAGSTDASPCRFELLRSGRSDADPAVRDEILRTCDHFTKNDPRRACHCMDDLLLSRWKTEMKRRDDSFRLALLSALPFGIALLFAWRGRRPARDAASGHT